MRRCLSTLLLVMAVLTAAAQIRGNNISVEVTPDHQDWTYRKGQTAQFTVRVLRSGTLVDNVAVSYEAGPEMYPDTKKDATLKDGTMTHRGTMKQAGFYRLKVVAHVDGRDYDGSCTAAFSPEELRPTTVMPADFDQYWQQALSDARAQAPLEPTCTLLPERSTQQVNVYEVSFQNVRWGSRTFGILSVPVKPGKYPALLRVPGAGVRPYAGDPWTAAKGVITLEIGIHGVSVTQPQAFYDRLADGPLNCYWNFNMDDRDQSYYKRVVLGCIRAVDYIAEYTPWDGKNLAVTGSSQGGFLSLATAAIDKRVSCYGAVHAALCDHTASLQGVACGWPHYFYWQLRSLKGKERQQAIDRLQARIETSRYYDGVNFARRITVPGWFSFGYNDDVVPPTTAWATYNSVTAPKQLSPYQQTAHFWYQEQWDEWQAWLLKQLGVE